MSDLALALGGGGARGIAHIHVLKACDSLGVRPCRIVGTSIGAIIGAGYAAGMSADDIREAAIRNFGSVRDVLAKLWKTRPPNLRQFLADGGLRLGQLNAERLVGQFLPADLPDNFEDLKIPLGVMATDFYARAECELVAGPLRSAIAASAALPAVFRPVKREGRVLIDGGILNPLPFDRLRHLDAVVVAVDVNGGPFGESSVMPTQMEALIGSSQLLMQAITETKLRLCPPHLLLRPPVFTYRVMDFMKTSRILQETASFEEEAKRAIDLLLADRRTARSSQSVVRLAPV